MSSRYNMRSNVLVLGAHATNTQTGVNVTTGATSANGQIPNDTGGNPPAFVRIVATAAAHVRIGYTSGVTALATDLMVQPGDGVIVATMAAPGQSVYVAAIQDSAAGKINATPVEWGS